jgi:hypothetical protein
MCMLGHALIKHVTNCNKHWKGINLISVAQLTAHVCYQYGSHIMTASMVAALWSLGPVSFLPNGWLLTAESSLLRCGIHKTKSLRLWTSKSHVSNPCFIRYMLICCGIDLCFCFISEPQVILKLDECHWTFKLKVGQGKVNFALEQTTKAQRGSRGIALLFP